MARPSNEHLTQDELDVLVFSGASEDRVSSILDDGRASILQHVAQCDKCRLLVSTHSLVQGRLISLQSQGIAPRRDDCPPAKMWFSFAGGMFSPQESERYLEHAVRCDHCGPLLKAAMEDITDTFSADEKSKIHELSSNSVSWQKDCARRLGKSDQERDSGPIAADPWWELLIRRRYQVFAIAASALTVLAIWLSLTWASSPETAERLLAQAYSDHRSLEMRIPGAKFAPMQVERGANDSSLDKSQFLLKAEALIGEKLRKNPKNVAWLQAKARADLLENRYTAAIQSLQSALAISPDSPSLLCDLGTAYYQQAENLHRDSDYGVSVDYFSRALAKSPRNPVALFNRAVVYERIFLLHEAENDWTLYLQIDPSGDWAEEAREHLRALRQKLQEHDEGLKIPLLGSTEFAKTIIPAQPDTWAGVDPRIEDYLDAAIQRWLPAAFPLAETTLPSERQTTALSSLVALGDILAVRHHDSWLKDFLRARRSKSLAAGVESLASAMMANASGDPKSALPEAQSAEIDFRAAGSKPGILRAQFEEIYALQRQFRSKACLAVVKRVESSALTEHYSWIAVETQLEKYSCLTSESIEFDRAAYLLALARQHSLEAAYGTLYLRALGFAASSETESGSIERAWHWDLQGLNTYWSGSYPSLRAQHFYDDLSIQAQNSERWYFAVALGREAVTAIAASPNRSGEGMERVELARSASHAHLWNEANQEYSQAVLVFNSLPQDESNRAFHADAEIGLAEVATEQGRIHDAVNHLTYAQSNLPADFEEYETWQSLYRTLAVLKSNSGDSLGAEQACNAVVVIAERGLQGLHSELERLRWGQANSFCYKTLVESAINRNNALDALNIWEFYLSSGVRSISPHPQARVQYSDLLDSHAALSVHPYEIKQDLHSLHGETILAYAELRGHFDVWVYDDRGIFWSRLAAPPQDLRRVANQFAGQCADSQSDVKELRANGRRLYEWLISPVIEHLDPKRVLTIEVDEDIAGIPFAALVDPSGFYLVERFPIVYLPGFGYRERLRRGKAITPEDSAIVVGEPALSTWDLASYPPLPDAELEAREVSKQFHRSQLLTGQAATSPALARALIGASVFHFAGHARSQPGHSGLVLAPDADSADGGSTLFGYDQITRASLPHLNLAVLSACSTERISEHDEGPDSLARAFLRTGVPHVVATRWQVNSAAATMFANLFYRNLLGGKSVPVALASSADSVRSVAGYSHPYYWASFDAFGLSQ